MLPLAVTWRTILLEVSKSILYVLRASMYSILPRIFFVLCSVVGVAQDVTDDRRHSQELREMQYHRASQEAKVETERNMTCVYDV